MGTRNYIAVVAASNCAAHTAETIARSYENEVLPPNVDGVVAFPHGEGCGHESVNHVDHVDYVHDGHRHAAHDDHWDEH